MKATGIRHGAAFCISFACALAPVSPHAQENCTPVHFEHGKSSATIRGTAPPDDVVCYTFDAATGQTASLKVAGRNLIISVIGVGDARDSWTFKTKAQTYKFVVGQLMRSVTNEPYVVTVSIK
jgi:hypothetical protein